MIRAVKLIVRDVLAFEHFEIEFGEHLTIVSGRNAAGKTSLIDTLRPFVEKGADATLLRAGATQGEAVWILSEDGEPLIWRYTVGPDGKPNRQIVAGNQTKTSPATTMQALLDGMSANPITFIRAEQGERARVFLQQSNVRLDKARLEAAGIVPEDPAILDQHGLTALQALAKTITTRREGVGGAKRRAKETAETLERQLLPERPSIDAELNAARQQLADAKANLDRVREQVNTMRDGQVREANEKCSRTQAEIDQQIAALQDKRRAAETTLRAELAEIDMAAAQMELAHSDKTKDELTTLSAAVAEMQKQRDIQIAQQQTRQQIERQRIDYRDLQAQWDALDKQLTELATIEKELLQQLPIKNVTVRDGELYDTEGVPFPRWNEQRQWSLAFEIARKRAGSFPFVWVDGLQFLDPIRQQQFIRAAERSGLQFLVTKVNVDCQCKHPHSVHRPKCTVAGCECSAYVDPGIVVERIGDRPTLFDVPRRRRK